MNPRLITPPTGLALDLEDAKAELGLTGVPEADTRVTAYIMGISAFAESKTNRSIMRQQWQVTLDYFPSAIELPRGPIVSVDSVTFRDQNGVLLEIDPADLFVDLESSPGYLTPGAGLYWPTTSQVGNAVVVKYTTGYAETADQVPPGIALYLRAKLVEQFDPMASNQRDLTKDTVQSSFLEHLLDRYWTPE